MVVLGVVVFVTAFAVIAACALICAFHRSERSVLLGTALSMVGVAWVFFYTLGQRAVAAVMPRVSGHRVLAPLGILLTVVMVSWLLRQPRERLVGLSVFMTRLGLVLIALVLVSVVLSQLRGSQALRTSRLVRELARPVSATQAPPPARHMPLRDIYLLVLDGHANARVLNEVFGFDNSSFENALRARGFLIPRDVRSNYVQTYLSLASLLNAAHLTQLTEDAGATSQDHSLPTYLVKNNRVARFLKARGYKYVLFPSAWWTATASSPLADETFDGRRRSGLLTEAYRTEFRVAVWRSSLLRFLFPRDREGLSLTEHILSSFQGMADLPMSSAPTFTFAHILLPHLPYVFDEWCRPLERPIPDWMDADTPEQRAAYIAQVKCVDTLVLQLVTRLLARSPTPPVILVVGDHGSAFSDIHFYRNPERVSRAFIRERFGAFGAFYLPAGGDSVFREPVTLVNVFAHVLRHYFDADLKPNPDDLYVSGEELYRFHRVDPEHYGLGARDLSLERYVRG